MYSDKIKFLQDLSKKSQLFAKIIKTYKKNSINFNCNRIFILCIVYRRYDFYEFYYFY